MLVDVESLRSKITGADYMKVAKELQGRVVAPDQDILNMVHWESVGLVDEYRYDFFNACLKGLQPEEVNTSVSVIHYAGPKPWMPIDINVHAHKIWWEYASRTGVASDFLYQTIVKEKHTVSELKIGLERAKYCMHVPFMSCDVEGIKYIGSSLDLTIMRRMYNTRENWSKREIDVFFQLAEKYYGISGKAENGIFLDIGGNIGTTSIYVHKAKAPGLKVIAFEPMADNIRMFKANCILNDITDAQITLVEKAVSNQCVTKVMEKNLFNPGMSRVVEDTEGDNKNTEKVESISLDDYLSANNISNEEVKYIWIDVEGFEGFVIDGAKNLLSNTRIPILMEFVPKYLKQQNCYELLLDNLKGLYTHFIWLDEPVENGRERVRAIDTLKEFAEQLGDGQADIFLIKDKDKRSEIFQTIHELERFRAETGMEPIAKDSKLEEIYGGFVKEKKFLFQLKEQFIDYVNDLLKLRSEKSWNEVLAWYNQNGIKELRGHFTEAYILRILLDVYKEEKERHYQSGQEISVLQFGSVEELLKVYFEMIFLLRRLEYDVEPENHKEVILYIKEKELSDIFLKCIFENGQIEDKEKVAKRLNELWREYGDERE